MTRSPFPGMDPYLEANWLDVHASLIVSARNALNERLPDDLIARSEERVGVESDDSSEDRVIGPDVRIFEPSEGGVATLTAVGIKTEADLAPLHLMTLSEPITERFIEIRDSNGRLITVIEFLSPSNKTREGMEDFRRKRDELLSGKVNFVEVDLNRSGDWKSLVRLRKCPEEAMTPYRAIIRLPQDSPGAWLHPFPLRKPLPAIKIPLRPNEPPVELPLQPIIEQAYHNGRYARTIDYSRPPQPSLDDEDARWADELLRAAGKR